MATQRTTAKNLIFFNAFDVYTFCRQNIFKEHWIFWCSFKSYHPQIWPFYPFLGQRLSWDSPCFSCVATNDAFRNLILTPLFRKKLRKKMKTKSYQMKWNVDAVWVSTNIILAKGILFVPARSQMFCSQGFFAPFEMVLDILRCVEERQSKNTIPGVHNVGNFDLFVPERWELFWWQECKIFLTSQ